MQEFSFFQALVIAFIQGATEFLPVSSSAHLLIPSLLTSWPEQGLAFDVAMHFGTLIAVLIYQRQALWKLSCEAFCLISGRGALTQGSLLISLFVATLPVVMVGLIFKDLIEQFLRTGGILAICSIVFGVVLAHSERYAKAKNESDLSWREALIIGLAQVLALIPGVSRSGITMTAGLYLGLSKHAAASFSFLLSVPVIAGAVIFSLTDLSTEELLSAEVLCGILVSMMTALLSMRLMFSVVDRIGFLPFAVYRVFLGFLILSVLFL
jgi:undecaprenyl-diphosphatase